MVFVYATIWYLFCGNFHCPFEASNQDVKVFAWDNDNNDDENGIP